MLFGVPSLGERAVQVLWATPMSFGSPIVQYEVQLGDPNGQNWKTAAYIEPKTATPGAAYAAQDAWDAHSSKNSWVEARRTKLKALEVGSSVLRYRCCSPLSLLQPAVVVAV
jgi:hypothetical protein